MALIEPLTSVGLAGVGGRYAGAASMVGIACVLVLLTVLVLACMGSDRWAVVLGAF